MFKNEILFEMKFYRMEQLLQELATKVLETHEEQLTTCKEEFERSIDELKSKLSSYETQLTEVHAKEKQWLTERAHLQATIDELNQYKKVSLVKNLSTAVDNLKRENETLKKQPASAPAAPTAPATPASGQKPKIEVKSKPATAVAPAPAPAPVPVEVPAPEPEVVEESEPVPEPDATEATETEPEEQVLDLMPLDLDGAVYFHDPETNDLYEVIGDPDNGEVGDIIGKLKPIMANGKEYMLNTVTQKFYNISSEGHLLNKAGEVKGGKAVFNKK